MVFKQIIFQNRYVELETPPFMAKKNILNFHFDYLNLRLIVIVYGKCKIEIILFWKAALFLVIVKFLVYRKNIIYISIIL